MKKEQFRIWEQGAAFNKMFGSDTDKYSESSIQRFKNNKLLTHNSKATPDKIFWLNFHQAYSKDKKDYSNEYLKSSLKILIRKQVQGGGTDTEVSPSNICCQEGHVSSIWDSVMGL